MDLPGIIKNKYTVSALILLALLGTDVILHKGMSRVILPEPFTDKVAPSRLAPLGAPLLSTNKNWTRAVNKTEWFGKVPPDRGGFEFDAYYDSGLKRFMVYHDSDRISNMQADSLLTERAKRNWQGGVWMDMKNLDGENQSGALAEAIRLRSLYGLQNKVVMESSRPELLQAFHDSGFYTSYYVPFFNPYVISEDSLVAMLGNIKNNLEKYPCASLSGYYFQYPVLRKFFPGYPVLTWADESTLSLVGYYFRRTLDHDSMVKIVLYPQED